ncbi:MAG: creatininase family protein [Candidatus Nezhaarchaeota archaeon]|nr:creatininase family protein [Candidatus Nezhaarchaeota archaeon]
MEGAEMRALRLCELSWVELKKLMDGGLDTIFIPVGTVEAHGKHLPLGTDCYIPEGIAEYMCSRLGGVVAPTIHYGVTRSLVGYPGSLTLTPGTFKSLIKELLISMKGKGFRFAVLVNGHGGNTEFLREGAREAYSEAEVKSVVVDWWVAAREVIERYYPTGQGHALAEETAALMAVRSDLLKKELYDEDEYVCYQDGFWAYPLPASALAYRKERPVVDFNANKAESFMREVCEVLTAEVKNVVERWRKML